MAEDCNCRFWGEASKMRGSDLINSMLPDEALMEILKYVDGRSSDRDACALVCKRWWTLESNSRQTLTLGATGQSDTCLAKMLQRFTNLKQVCVDERLPVPLPVNHHSFPGGERWKEETGNARGPIKLPCKLRWAGTPVHWRDAGQSARAEVCGG